MKSPGQAEVHLTVVNGGREAQAEHGYQPGMARAIARIPLGQDEWALALPQPSAWRAASRHVRELIPCTRPHAGRQDGQRYWIVRAQPGALDPRIGPAILYHGRHQTVMVCDGDHIAAQAADMLSRAANRAVAEIAGPAALESLRVCVAREEHWRLLARSCHPAVVIASSRQVTVHVCADLLTPQLAEAMSALCTACARHLAQPGPATVLWPASHPL